MKNYKIYIALLVVTASVTTKSVVNQTMLQSATVPTAVRDTPIPQLAVLKKYFKDAGTIPTITKVMDEIENKGLGYPDYAKRTGLIWSDVSVKHKGVVEILEEFKTKKATLVDEGLKDQNAQSILDYPKLKAIVCEQVLPKMLEHISTWEKKDLPEKVFAQIFFQRCNVSEAMDWHQDPGEDYDPQAHYSLVLMLSRQSDPVHGWKGGKFFIRKGLPEDKYSESDVKTIIPRYNQGILFNNQINCHATTPVEAKTDKTARDIIVITICLNQLPKKKD